MNDPQSTGWSVPSQPATGPTPQAAADPAWSQQSWGSIPPQGPGSSAAAVPGATAAPASTNRSAFAVAVAAICALVMVVIIVLTAAAFVIASSLRTVEDPVIEDPGYINDPVPGTVIDAQGAPVDDRGTQDAPARVGTDSLRWDTADGGALTVTVRSIEWDADAAVRAADPSAPAPAPGSHYAAIIVDGTYTGTQHATLGSDLEISMVTDGGWYPDMGTVRSPTALWRTGGISDGEKASGQVFIEVPEAERASAQLEIAPWGDDHLYVADH